MPSPEAILAAQRRFMRCCRADSVPDPADLPDLAADWMLVLGELTDEQLADAAVRRLRDPQHGSFWPTPGDLLAFVPKALDDDEGAWLGILERIAGGRYSVADLLTAEQTRALGLIGGVWALRRAEVGVELATLRRRFLSACADQRSARPALPGPERAGLPPSVERFLGGPDAHAERRRRLLDDARDEQ